MAGKGGDAGGAGVFIRPYRAFHVGKSHKPGRWSLSICSSFMSGTTHGLPLTGGRKPLRISSGRAPSVRSESASIAGEPATCCAHSTGLVNSVQVVYNIFDQAPEDILFPACERLGVLLHPAVTTTIPGMRRPAHVEQNLACGAASHLPGAVVDALRVHRWERTPDDRS